VAAGALAFKPSSVSTEPDEAEIDVLDFPAGALENPNPLPRSGNRGGVALNRYQCATDDVGDETGVTGSRSGVDVEDHAWRDQRGVLLGLRGWNDIRAGQRLGQLPGPLTPAVRGAGLLTWSAVAACAKQK